MSYARIAARDLHGAKDAKGHVAERSCLLN